MGTAMWIKPEFWHSHRQVNLGSIRIATLIVDHGAKQDSDPDSQFPYIIPVL